MFFSLARRGGQSAQCGDDCHHTEEAPTTLVQFEAVHVLDLRRTTSCPRGWLRNWSAAKQQPYCQVEGWKKVHLLDASCHWNHILEKIESTNCDEWHSHHNSQTSTFHPHRYELYGTHTTPRLWCHDWNGLREGQIQRRLRQIFLTGGFNIKFESNDKACNLICNFRENTSFLFGIPAGIETDIQIFSWSSSFAYRKIHVWMISSESYRLDLNLHLWRPTSTSGITYGSQLRPKPLIPWDVWSWLTDTNSTFCCYHWREEIKKCGFEVYWVSGWESWYF